MTLIGGGLPSRDADQPAPAYRVGAVRARSGLGPRTVYESSRCYVDPDATLADEARVGRLEVFETLVRRYQTRMVNFAQAIVRDIGGADDVAQETVALAYRSLGRFRGDSAFKIWLYTITTNMARTALERRGRRERVGNRSLDDDRLVLGAEQVDSGFPGAESMLVTRDAIDRALARLSDELRVAVK